MSARASRSTWPPEDADELEVRLPLSSFMRWVNLLGWSALAIGNLQLVAPFGRDRARRGARLGARVGRAPGRRTPAPRGNNR